MGYYSKFNLRWSKEKDETTLNPKWQRLADLVGEDKVDAVCLFFQKAVPKYEWNAVDKEIGSYITDHPEISYALTEKGHCNEEAKWYDHKYDMIAMSLKFPDVRFTMHRHGEEDGDTMVYYYLNGRCEEHRVEPNIPAPSLWKVQP